MANSSFSRSLWRTRKMNILFLNNCLTRQTLTRWKTFAHEFWEIGRLRELVTRIGSGLAISRSWSSRRASANLNVATP